MARLRLLGFTLSIDDFGTGYASMEKLQKYPFTELKLDKSYVSNARNRKISLAIMKSSIELAKQLKMLTVAEGVESLDDYHFAREIGVDIIQGFYISKPVDASEIENLLLPSKIQLPR